MVQYELKHLQKSTLDDLNNRHEHVYVAATSQGYVVNELGNIIVMSSRVKNISMVAAKNYSRIFCRPVEDVAAYDL